MSFDVTLFRCLLLAKYYLYVISDFFRLWLGRKPRQQRITFKGNNADQHSRWLRWHPAAIFLALTFAISTPGSTSNAYAAGDGVIGWSGATASFPTPEAACKDWWNWAGMNDPGYLSRFIGAFPPADGSWKVRDCSWTSWIYLCQQEEAGHVGDCGTVLPGSVFFNCADGYTATPEGRCVRNADLPPEQPATCGTNPQVGSPIAISTNPAIGNPILVSSGAKLLDVEDFSTSDGRLRISRSYRSTAASRANTYYQKPLGLPFGWQFNFSYELQLGAFFGSPSSPNATVTLLAPDGSSYDFILQSNGTWKAQTALGAIPNDYRLEFVGTLPANLATIKNTQSQWRIVGADDRTWTLKTFTRVNGNPVSFNIARPTLMQERDGYSWTFTYATDGGLSTIVDTFSRTISFSWYNFFVSSLPNIAGSLPFPEAVKEITYPDGTKTSYLYDPTPATSAPSTSAIQRLIGVKWRNSGGTIVDSATYHYEDTNYPRYLTGISDNRPVRVATYAYDTAGRAVSTEEAGGANRFTVAYGTLGAQSTRTVTNVLGRADIYKFDRISGSAYDIHLAGVNGQATAHCPASTTAITYDGNGFPSSRTDEEGRVTTYINDTRGRPTSIDLADGTPAEQNITIGWHGTYNVPVTLAKPGLTTTWTYNGSGRLTTRTDTDTTTHTLPYPTSGQTRTWTYTYTTGGLVSTVDGPLAGTGDTVTYTYDAAGYVKTYKNQVNQTTTVNTVNGRGQPTKITDPNGLVTDITYDARGRILTTNANPVGVAAQTLVTYDATGNVTQLTQPDGSYLTFVYDNNNRITLITNANGDTAAYTYDAMDNVASQELSNGYPQLFFRWQKTFDELGRVITLTGTDDAVWSYAYDKVGNLKTITDPNTKNQAYAYDALNRLLSFTDERADVTSSTYGNTDLPATTTDDRSVVTSYVRNGWGEAIQEKSNDIGTTVYQRSAVGKITKRTDARAVVANYTYDNAGRITSTAYPAQTTSNVTYTYDSIAAGNFGKGRLTGVTDAAGTVAYTYDILGRATREVRVIGAKTYTTNYEWNAAGKMVATIYPSGRRIDVDRNVDGDIEVVRQTPSGGAQSWITYYVGRTPFGPRLGVTYANDTREARNYDEDGRLTSLEVVVDSTSVNLLNQGYLYADQRNLTAINDLMNAANNETYGYTANGFLATAQGPWGSYTFTIDGVGNRTQRVKAGSPATTDVYALTAGSNKLASITTNGTLSRSLTSDAAGNIATEVSGGVTKTYTWNHPGQLSGFKLGTVQQGNYVYDYLSRLVSRNLPVPATTLHYIHDLDGNIIAEYNASGALLREYIWLEERPLAVIDNTIVPAKTYWVQTDQLERPIMMTDDNAAVVWRAKYLPFGEVASITGPASLDMRFPGQWFQLESGLNYNWHRHYDPTTGRYLQPDPLGMPDGPSRWAYLRNSPLMGIDRRGLDTEALVGFGVGGTIVAFCSSGVGTVACACVVAGAAIAYGGAYLSSPASSPEDPYILKSTDADSPPEITPRPDLPPLSGGRAGEKVKGLKGPPNSAIPGGGDRIFVTDKDGNVVVDITPDRAKDVTPGVGFGDKRPPTPQERDLLDKLKR